MGILELICSNEYLIFRFVFRYCNNNVPELLNSFFANLAAVTIWSSANDSTGFWPPSSLHTLGADGHI